MEWEEEEELREHVSCRRKGGTQIPASAPKSSVLQHLRPAHSPPNLGYLSSVPSTTFISPALSFTSVSRGPVQAHLKYNFLS